MKKFVSLTLVLLMAFAIFAVSFAAADDIPSPTTGKGFYSITVGSEGDGDASTDKNKISVSETGDVTLTAIENGGTFIKWIITGTYEKISGDETSKVLVIRPTSDINATAQFSSDSKPVPSKASDSSTSPKTGDVTPVVIALVLMAMFGGAFAVKKIKE